MKVLRNMESGNINIKKMGIIKALLVVILSILLEGLGQVPVEILNLFSGKFETAGPYIYFVLGVVVKYYVIIILLKWFSSRSDEEKSKHQLNRRSFAYAALMIIAFRVIFDNSLILWVNNIPMPDFINRAFEELSISPIILILSVALIAPVYEEIIFRGILLRGMAKKMNPAIAIVISSLLFALVHMNIPQGINAFLLGLFIGLIYLRTGSIYLSIFAHFINNFLAISISSLFSLISGKYAIEMHGLFFILGMILLAIACKGYKQNKIQDLPNIYKEFIEI